MCNGAVRVCGGWSEVCVWVTGNGSWPTFADGDRVRTRQLRRAAISPEEYRQIRDAVHSQSLRALRRQFDYGKRVRTAAGLIELAHWVRRILHEDGQVYTLTERAAAFEIAACEAVADQWSELEGVACEPLILTGPADRMLLYRCLLHAGFSSEQRAGFVEILSGTYRQHADWISQRARARERAAGSSGTECLWRDSIEETLAALEEIEPIPVGYAQTQGLQLEVDRLHEEGRRLEKECAELRDDLEFAEERARRAHARLKTADGDLVQVRRQLRDASEAVEMLCSERRARIRSEREAGTAHRELARLRT